MLNIIFGLLGLGMVVFFHELGHFIAARISGIDVEAFSIGWGSPILKFKFKETEYRIGILPFGGYCKMKGEQYFQEALETGAKEIRKVKGSLLTSHPLKRIFVSFAGPLFNVILTILILFFIYFIGFKYSSYDNRIYFSPESKNYQKAIDIGFQTGDRILSVNNEETINFTKLAKILRKEFHNEKIIKLERGDTTLEVSLPAPVDESKESLIEWKPFIKPIIGKVAPKSAAQIAGLKSGDLILSMGGEKILEYNDITSYLLTNPKKALVEYRRGEAVFSTLIIFKQNEIPPKLGIQMATQIYKEEGTPFLSSIRKAILTTGSWIQGTLEGLADLFLGKTDIRDTVSGPIRITQILGETAGEAIHIYFSVLASLSIALFILNLLPIPILDGGQILLHLAELIKRKPLHPKTLFRYQMVGAVFVLVILVLVVFNDIFSLLEK